MRHSTHGVTLEVDYDTAYDYISDWRRMPEWGIHFFKEKGVREEGGQVIMDTVLGEIPARFRHDRELGVLDVVFPGDSIGPGRLTQIGDSCVYSTTFSVPADTLDDEFETYRRNMEEELQALKQILEKDRSE